MRAGVHLFLFCQAASLGQWLRRSPPERKIRGSIPAYAVEIFQGRVILLLLLFLFFSSACTGRRRGGVGGWGVGVGGGGAQLSVSSKAGGLEKGHPLSSEGVCHGVAPSFSWSSSRSPAGVLGVVCPEGRLVYRHTCSVSEPLDLLLFDVL